MAISREAVLVLAIAIVVVLVSVFIFVERFVEKQPQSTAKPGLHVVVTFPSLKPDVEMLICPDDTVDYIAPPGVDPHEYQLTPADIEKLKKADIVVSTAHTKFELDIRRLKSEGIVRALLVEIPNITGIKVRYNPALGVPNYHWVIYDPNNLRVFAAALINELGNLRPECRDTYTKNFDYLNDLISQLLEDAPNLSDATFVASTPVMQYAIEWTGARMGALVLKEEGVPPTPQDLNQISHLLSSGAVRFAAVINVAQNQLPSTDPNVYLAGEAEKYGVPVIRVPSPLEMRPTIEKLQIVVVELKRVFR